MADQTAMTGEMVVKKVYRRRIYAYTWRWPNKLAWRPPCHRQMTPAEIRVNIICHFSGYWGNGTELPVVIHPPNGRPAIFHSWESALQFLLLVQKNEQRSGS